METDIRKPVSTKKTALIERPTHSHASHTPTTTSDTDPVAVHYTEPLSDDEDDSEAGDPMSKPANDEIGVAGLPADAHAQAEDAKAFREKNASASQYLDPNTASSVAVSDATATGADYPKLTPKNLKKMLAQKYHQSAGEGEEQPDVDLNRTDSTPKQDQGPSAPLDTNTTEFIDNFTYSGKRIAVPVRVEPKVNFALERTLLVSNDVRPRCFVV